MPFNQLCLPWPRCVWGCAVSEWITYQPQLRSQHTAFSEGLGYGETIEIFLEVDELRLPQIFFHEFCSIIQQ